MLAFALISNPVSAYTNSFNSTDSSVNGVFHDKLRGGCLFAIYPNVYWNDKFIGDVYLGNGSASSPKMCNYNVVNGAYSYRDDTIHGDIYKNVNSGSLSSVNHSGTGGNSNPASWLKDTALNYGASVRSTLYSSGLYMANASGSPKIVIPSQQNISNQKVMFFYRFSSFGTAYIHPSIETSKITIKDLQGNTVSNDIVLGNFILNTDLSLNITCGADDTEKLFPSIHDYDFAGNDSDCYITGSFPTYANYSFEISDLIFTPADGSSYNISSDSIAFDKNYDLDFLAFNPSTYTQLANNNETYYSAFLNFRPYVYVLLCDSVSECDSWKDIESNQYYTHNSGSQDFPDYNPDNNDSSVFMSWFNVFNISFIFPFRALFNSFTNANCVDIPIIGGMLNNPSARYCTWWSSNVRDILTPVLTMASMMILTGFVIRWLNDKNTSVTISGGSS